MSEDKARQLYEAAAEAGLAQQRPPAPEDHLTTAMQEQEEKLRVRALYDLSGLLMSFGPLSLQVSVSETCMLTGAYSCLLVLWRVLYAWSMQRYLCLSYVCPCLSSSARLLHAMYVMLA